MNTWGIMGKQMLTAAEVNDLRARQVKHLEENSAFDPKRSAKERTKVERNLNARIAAVYNGPPESWLENYRLPKKEPPLKGVTAAKPPLDGSSERPPAPPSPPDTLTAPLTDPEVIKKLPPMPSMESTESGDGGGGTEAASSSSASLPVDLAPVRQMTLKEILKAEEEKEAAAKAAKAKPSPPVPAVSPGAADSSDDIVEAIDL